MRHLHLLSKISLGLLVAATVTGLGCQRAPETDARTDAAPVTAAPDDHAAEVHRTVGADPSDSGRAAPATPTGEPQNPVQAEMRLLLEATRDWVTAIAQHDLASIPPGISRVHGARLVTEEALKAGKYAPPKGGAAALSAFVRQDEAFHDELVALLQAAKANDLPAATRQLGVVLDGCTSCHMTFRY